MKYETCVLILSKTLSETFFIPRRTERDMIKNLYWSSRKVTIILEKFEWKFIFRDRFS
jgi:hypothetical protein